MPVVILIAKSISILAFLYYGCLCVFTSKLIPEFQRYGLSSLRIFTGSLEISGALGILAGIYFPILTLLASSGLSLMMLCAIYVRIEIRDSLLEMLPAFFLFCVNILIAYRVAG